MDLISIIEVSGIAVSFFIALSVLVAEFKHNNRSFFLAAFFALLTFFQVLISQETVQFIRGLEHEAFMIKRTYFISITVTLLNLFPLLYLHLQKKAKSFNRKEAVLLMLMPLFVVILVLVTRYLMFYFSDWYDTRIGIVQLIIAFFVQFGWVHSRIRKAYKSHSKSIEQTHSYKIGVDMKYLLKIHNLLIVFFAGIFCFEALFYWNEQINNSLFIAIYVFYSGVRIQKHIHQPFNYKNEEVVSNVQNESKEFIALDEESKDELFDSIVTCLKEKELFLVPTLTVNDIAKEIQSNSKYISDSLKNNDTSFYQLVNSMRTEKATHMLKDEQYSNLSIDAISFSCGFKSRATFFKYFKKEIGTTPSAYRSVNS